MTAPSALPRVGCGAAIVCDCRLLLILRKKHPEANCWGLPGGKIEPFEAASEAAKREINEELGIDIEPAELLCAVDQIDAEAGTHWLSLVYLATTYRGTPTIREPEAISAFGFFALSDIPENVTVATTGALKLGRLTDLLGA